MFVIYMYSEKRNYTLWQSIFSVSLSDLTPSLLQGQNAITYLTMFNLNTILKSIFTSLSHKKLQVFHPFVGDQVWVQF